MEYTARRFVTGLSEWRQKLYVSSFPAIRMIMRIDMRISAAGAETGCVVTAKALDFVAQRST